MNKGGKEEVKINAINESDEEKGEDDEYVLSLSTRCDLDPTIISKNSNENSIPKANSSDDKLMTYKEIKKRSKNKVKEKYYETHLL